MRAPFVALAVALIAAACSDTPTNPAAVPTDVNLANETLYCPPPFGPVAAKDHEADNNHDGIVCGLEIVHEDNSIHTTFVDNNVPVQLGICPNGFTASVYKKPSSLEATDRNGDGWLCTAVRPNGNEVVIDNRFEVDKGTGGEAPAEPHK